MMIEHYEDLLQAGRYTPPADFSDRVMARIMDQPEPGFAAPPRTSRPQAQWLALAAASLLGAIQLATFIFGVWLTASAS